MHPYLCMSGRQPYLGEHLAGSAVTACSLKLVQTRSQSSTAQLPLLLHVANETRHVEHLCHGSAFTVSSVNRD